MTNNPQLPARIPLHRFTQLDEHFTFSLQISCFTTMRGHRIAFYIPRRALKASFPSFEERITSECTLHSFLDVSLKERFVISKVVEEHLLSALGGKFFLSWRYIWQRPRRPLLVTLWKHSRGIQA